MAKKTTVATFREIIANIRADKFSPVYLLMGEEEYYIDKITELLEKKVVKEEDKDFNLLTFYGSDTDIEEVISAAQQYPVFSDRKIVLLKEAQSLYSKSHLDKLAFYVEKPNPTTVLVVTYKGDNLSSTSALMKKGASSGNAVIFKSEKTPDYQLSMPISDYCSAKGVKIDDKAVALLCDYIGNPLSKLFGEIDKLLLNLNPGENLITAELIEKNIGISKEYNSFELLKALSRKDYAKSMRIVNYFESNPKNNPSVMIITVLFNFFSKLCIASSIKDKTDPSLMEALELKNSYALRDYKEALRYYSFESIVNIIHDIRMCDAQSKGIESYKGEYDLLKELIFKIVSRR